VPLFEKRDQLRPAPRIRPKKKKGTTGAEVVTRGDATGRRGAAENIRRTCKRWVARKFPMLATPEREQNDRIEAPTLATPTWPRRQEVCFRHAGTPRSPFCRLITAPRGNQNPHQLPPRWQATTNLVARLENPHSPPFPVTKSCGSPKPNPVIARTVVQALPDRREHTRITPRSARGITVMGGGAFLSPAVFANHHLLLVAQPGGAPGHPGRELLQHGEGDLTQPASPSMTISQSHFHHPASCPVPASFPE